MTLHEHYENLYLFTSVSESHVPVRINNLAVKDEVMKVHYDDAVDALYLELSEETPDGAVELSDGINVDTTSAGKIAGIEILGASSRIDLKTILSYSVDVDKTINAGTPQ